MQQSEFAAYSRNLINAIPSMMFIVDEDVRVHDLNTAAAEAFHLDGGRIRNKRTGDILHCLHSSESPNGCGQGKFCPDCVIRQVVLQAMQGRKASRVHGQFDYLVGNRARHREFLITASPFDQDDRRLCILILEDITEVTALRGLLPICAKCKSIRADKNYWRSVEQYFTENMGVAFSHGLCPSCMEEELAKLAKPGEASARSAPAQNRAPGR